MFKPSSHDRAFKITFTEGFSRNTSSTLSDDAQILGQLMSELWSPSTRLPVKDAANVHRRWYNNASNLNTAKRQGEIVHQQQQEDPGGRQTEHKVHLWGHPRILSMKTPRSPSEESKVNYPGWKQRSIFSLEYGSFLEELTNKTSCPTKIPNCLKAGTQNEWWKRTSILPAYFLCQK